ncbi:MAG: response regulator receiver protein [Gemmatimonadetes bacterium]|jgi:two-component system chemotaxis response regulator CheY|nr:response regulator receiver protein [Gemmatimonadota bacterium]
MSISVLVCDDLASVQSMMRRLLERDGLTVAGVASTADEVLQRYRECKPDVVLLDYRMPGAEGLSLLQKLLALDPDARVVMCSGLGDPDVRRDALEYGAVDWVLKPIYATSLVASLRGLVGKPGDGTKHSSARHSA